MSEKTNMTMAVAFPDGSPSFVHGFEAGMVYQEMKEGRLVIDRGIEEGFPVHTANIELFQRLATANSFHLELQSTDLEEWTAMRLTYAPGGGRAKLSVVE